MKLFDPHIHMTSRTTDDYEAMAAGRDRRDRRALVLARPAAHPRRAPSRTTSAALLGWERFRASQFGIRHFCTMALNPKEANNPRVADGVHRAPAALPRQGRRRRGRRDRLRRPDAGRGEVLRRPARAGARFDLPVLVHTPHRDKKRGTERSSRWSARSGFPEERVAHRPQQRGDAAAGARHRLLGRALDLPVHEDGRAADGRAREAATAASASSSTAPPTGASAIRSRCRRPSRVMREAGIADADIETIVWDNPVAFFAQSGRLIATARRAAAIDQSAAVRGQLGAARPDARRQRGPERRGRDARARVVLERRRPDAATPARRRTRRTCRALAARGRGCGRCAP